MQKFEFNLIGLDAIIKKIIKYYFNNSKNHKYSSLNFLSNTLNKHFKKKKYY